MSCSLGNAAKRRIHAVEVGVLEGETLALDELDDFAVAEVDGGNQHRMFTITMARRHDGTKSRRSIPMDTGILRGLRAIVPS